jgi:feruloyl esterase
VPGITLEVTKAEWHPPGPAPAGPMGPPSTPLLLPAYCRVDLTVDRRSGVGGTPYGIGVAIALPDDWNGRLLMQGGGGLNGSVAPPIGPVAAGDRPALVRGFAVVSTDTGHQGAVFDASFMQDQQAALDFAFVAIGRVAALAKTVVAGYYGRAPERSYFTGCSTGGREGMVMSQRYPTYFDGIVSGAPAMRTGHSNLALRAMAVAFNRISPRDADGRPNRAAALSDGDRQLAVAALLKACDDRDGVRDGTIADPLGCRFSPASLVCAGAKAEGCLSAEQARAIEIAFAGPRDSKGVEAYTSFPYDTGIVTQGRTLPGILSPGAGPPGPPVMALEQDVDAEVRAATHNPQAILTDTASWTNLSTFAGRGGKLIFFHGVSDPWFSAWDTTGYYDRLGEANGGAAAVREWSRLFLAPGVGHCGGGAGALDRFDLLTPLVEWVEKGAAPASVIATSVATPRRTRPLCAYPQYAHYKGSGSPDDADNYECR